MLFISHPTGLLPSLWLCFRESMKQKVDTLSPKLPLNFHFQTVIPSRELEFWKVMFWCEFDLVIRSIRDTWTATVCLVVHVVLPIPRVKPLIWLLECFVGMFSNWCDINQWSGDKGMVSDSNIFLWHKAEVNKKKVISKISVDPNFTFTSYAWLCALALLQRLRC